MTPPVHQQTLAIRQTRGLLNQARQQTEKIIDTLYKKVKQRVITKPRTYRKIARKEYLKVARARRASRNQKRKAVKKQLWSESQKFQGDKAYVGESIIETPHKKLETKTLLRSKNKKINRKRKKES